MGKETSIYDDLMKVLIPSSISATESAPMLS
jgi:hypothetical protein